MEPRNADELNVFERMGQRLRAYAEKDGRGYPDWAMRYVPIVRRLNKMGALENARIVEIGTNENGFSRFSGRRVIAVDRAFEHVRATVRSQDALGVVADAAALPFRENAFDLAICVETFEHMPAMVRFAAIAEMTRVMKPSAVAVITFPFGEAARAAEVGISAAYWKHTQGTMRWFEEHAAEELPDPEVVAEQFATRLRDSHAVRREKNANIYLWRWTWLVLMCGWPGRGNALVQVFLRWMTPILCRAHFGTCYRAIIWVEPCDNAPR